MAEEKSGWSNLLGQSGVINYPLLGLLPNIYSKGYQYQSQPSYPQRDARGDWGRAINESLNQYFSQLPQYYQQVRANQLTQQQLAQQQQLFDMKMQEAERTKKARESWPETVASLPISDSAKKVLSGLPYEQGVQQLSTILTQNFKPKARTLTKAEAESMNMPFGTQVLPNNELKPPAQAVLDFRNRQNVGPYKGPLSKEMESARPYLAQDQNGKPIKLYSDEFYEGLVKGVDQSPVIALYDRFKLNEDPNNWNNIKTIDDFIDLLGSKPPEYRVWSFVLNSGFPEGHPLKNEARLYQARTNTKLANDGSMIRYFPANANTPQNAVPKPKGKREIFVQGGKSITLNSLADAEKRAFPNINKESWKKEVMIANPSFFPSMNPNEMKASTDFEDNRKLQIPQLDSKNLTEGDVLQGQNQMRNNNATQVQLQGGVIAEITAPTLGTSKQIQEQRGFRQDALNQVDNIDEFSYLLEQEDTYNLLELGANRGRVEAVMYRVIAEVQQGRDFGVLTPSEMVTLKKSVPDVNTKYKLLLRAIDRVGADAFNQNVLQVLRQETITNLQQAESNLRALGGTPTDYKQSLRDTIEFKDWRSYYSDNSTDASGKRMNRRGFGDNETIVE